ncbi:hypothetical protein [Streptomyces aureus]|uniref:hypothetical protein n=1 Tax=Streptomyces aureus TaxID=193461 RepID=UPI0007C461CA|nr:hypothetical protein [Streptomyces aureus]
MNDNDVAHRRDYLANILAARTHGNPITTHSVVRFLAQSRWSTAGRNTVRKDLRALAARGLLTAVVDLETGRRIYHLKSQEGRRSMSIDADRVIGQIQRGEVDASADAARRIAARHQAAYGDAVWGPAPTVDVTALPQTAQDWQETA